MSAAALAGGWLRQCEQVSVAERQQRSRARAHAHTYPDKVAHAPWLAVDADSQAVAMPRAENGLEEGGALGWAAAVRVADHCAAAVRQLQEPSGVLGKAEAQ